MAPDDEPACPYGGDWLRRRDDEAHARPVVSQLERLGHTEHLGLALQAVEDDAVEDRARELVSRVAADPDLARAAIGNFRKEVVDGVVSRDIATQFERQAQMWSMRRAIE